MGVTSLSGLPLTWRCRPQPPTTLTLVLPTSQLELVSANMYTRLFVSGPQTMLSWDLVWAGGILTDE